MNVAGTIFTIVFAMPLFIAVILPLAVVYYFVQKIYVATARQVQQLQVNKAFFQDNKITSRLKNRSREWSL